LLCRRLREYDEAIRISFQAEEPHMDMIRQIDIADKETAERVLAVQLPAYRIEAELIGFDGIPALKDTAESLAACGESFFGYWAGDELAGAVSFKETHDPKGRLAVDIHRLIVHPDFFRRGIGSALISHLFGVYDRQGASYTVHTGALNIPARKLYARLGFTETGGLEVAPGVAITGFMRKLP
jgi:ribosomal protein S18 acetylase RimI-like enzyme